MAFAAGIKGLSGYLGTDNKYQSQGGATLDQANQAYSNTQSGLDQQQAFINAVNAQNGLGNQANVFAQQQQLANQFQGVANGTGPNPALAQLNQTTGANIANQAALLAGQRGASANVGLIGRQAAQQGGALQQQAIGQGATLQAQQQLNALSGLQQQQANMASLAGTQVGQQQNALSGYNQFAQGQQGNVLGALANQDRINSGVAGQNQQTQAALTGGLLNAGGQAAAMAATGGASAAVPQKSVQSNEALAGTNGALVPGMAQGGIVPDGSCASHVTSHLENMAQGGKVPGKAEIQGDSPKNDTTAIMASPGEIVIPRSILEAKDPLAAAMAFVKAHLGKPEAGKHHFATGGMIEDDPEGALQYNGTTAPVAGVPVPQDLAPQAPPVEVEATGPTLASTSLVPGSLPNGGGGSPIPESGAGPITSAPTVSGLGGNQLSTGIGNAIAGNNLEAKAVGQQNDRNVGLIDSATADMAKQQKVYQQSIDELNQHRDALQQDIANGRIDPNRYLGKMDTTGKVMTGIGLLLSGIGSGLTGKDNMAMKYLQTQIDQDIDAQKSELGKKENLLSANLRQYGDLTTAINTTRAMMNDTLSKQIEKSAAQSGSEVAKAKAQQAIGDLQVKTAAEVNQMAMRRAALAGATSTGGDPASLVPSLVPADHQKDVFKEISDRQLASDSEDKMKELFKTAAQENTVLRTGAGLVRTPPSIKVLNALADPLIHDKEGRINELEQKHVQALWPAPGDKEATIAAKEAGLQDFINSKKAAPTAKAYGIDLEKFPSTSTNPEMKLDDKEKGYVKWARQNPSDMRSKLLLKKFGLSQ